MLYDKRGAVGDVWVRKPKSGAAQYYLVIGSAFDFEHRRTGDDGMSYCLGTVPRVPLLNLKTGKTTSVPRSWLEQSMWELFCSSSNHDQLKLK